MKIIEIVRFNGGYAYVLDETEPMVYHEENVMDSVFGQQRMLIGQNSVGMMDFLTYHNNLPSKAFAGREFSIKMEDGSTRKLKDFWWDEGCSRWQKQAGVRLVNFTHNTMDDLVDCCVFFSGAVREDLLGRLVSEFFEQHPNYKPWEYKAWDNHCRKIRQETYVVCEKCRFVDPGLSRVGETCPRCEKTKLIPLSELK